MTEFKKGDRIRLTDAYSRKNPGDFPGVIVTGRTGTVVNFDMYYDVILDEPIVDPDDEYNVVGTENFTALLTEDEIEPYDG